MGLSHKTQAMVIRAILADQLRSIGCGNIGRYCDSITPQVRAYIQEYHPYFKVSRASLASLAVGIIQHVSGQTLHTFQPEEEFLAREWLKWELARKPVKLLELRRELGLISAGIRAYQKQSHDISDLGLIQVLDTVEALFLEVLREQCRHG